MSTPSTVPFRVVVASANPHKAAEIVEILASVFPDVVLIDRPADLGDVEETGATLEDNARLKAVAVMQASGELSISDDTGLSVAALNGEPGVYSARYAGEHASYDDNVSKLLLAMKDKSDRRAEFRTVAIALFPDGTEVVAEGVVEGVIAEERLGDGGFGYDPLFVPSEGDGRSFAQMDGDEKHQISHRGRALRSLAEKLGQLHP